MRRLDQCDNRLDELLAPVILLHKPQLGENIGAVARVMANFGLSRLRLIAPRDGWPNPAANVMASGADWILEQAKIFADFEEAVADLKHLMATSARLREMQKTWLSPAEAATRLCSDLEASSLTGILFGGEANGLPNEIISRADTAITYPVGIRHRSLNLAQAVCVLAYARAEGLAAGENDYFGRRILDDNDTASKAELFGLFGHLDHELDRAGFYFPPEKKKVMQQNI